MATRTRADPWVAQDRATTVPGFERPRGKVDKFGSVDCVSSDGLAVCRAVIMVNAAKKTK